MRFWRWLPPSALLILGLVLALSQAQTKEVERLSALPVLGVMYALRAPLGSDVLVEARVAAQPTENPQGFVVYGEAQYRGRESDGPSVGQEIWQERAVARPRLEVADSSGRSKLCNDDYLLQGKLGTWQSEAVPSHRGLFEESTLRRFGVRVGDAVVLDAVRDVLAGVPCLRTKTLFAGTATDYLDSERSGIWVLRLVGLIFSSLGVALFGVVWLFSRRRPRAVRRLHH